MEDIVVLALAILTLKANKLISKFLRFFQVVHVYSFQSMILEPAQLMEFVYAHKIFNSRGLIAVPLYATSGISPLGYCYKDDERDKAGIDNLTQKR